MGIAMSRSVYIVRCLFALALAAGTASAVRAQSQEAQKTIDQYIKASGGSKALSRAKTVSLQGTIATANGTFGTFTLDSKLPNRYYSELILSDKHVIEAYNGKSAWHDDGSGSPSTFTGDESLKLQAAALIANSHLLNLKKNKITISLIGHALINGKDAVEIEVTSSSGVKRQLFFDSQSHLLARESGELGGTAEELTYSDYRAEGGIQLPHKLTLRRGSDTYDVNLTQTAVNSVIGERVFDLPVKSQVHLPDLKALFKEIDENQKAVDKIKEDYAGTRVEETTELESDGRVKKHEVNEFTFFYFDGEEVSTLVKKDGKSLTDSEAKKEADNTQKRLEVLEKQKAKKDAKEEKAKEQGKDPQSDKQDPGIETFLRTSQFVNPRRERFRGQDVLVFDFEGNPEFKPGNLVEKIVQKLAGVVWIDEKAHDVARLEAYFVSDAKIAGGLLANLQKGTGFVYEQAYLNNEVWLPTYAEAHVGARVLLVKGFRVNAVVRYSDYKKYHVETTSAVGVPKGQDASPQHPTESKPQP